MNVDMTYTATVDEDLRGKKSTREHLRHEIKNMWRETFKASDEWLDMYFKKVYRQDDLLMLTATDDDDVIASSLLLQRYMMSFHSKLLGVGYISGAVTRRRYRDRGYMRQLMVDALQASYKRGDVLLTLIPANRQLYFYYDSLGFTTIFYVDEERYTDKHSFPVENRYDVVEPRGNRDVSRFVDECLRRRDNVVLHPDDDLQNIIDDTLIDGGVAAALANNATGEIEAFVLAAPGNERVRVRELLYRSDDARNAALSHVKMSFPNQPMTVVTPPDSRSIPLRARGMGRIINAEKLLAAYAARYPELKMNLKLYDSLLPQNNHIYIIDRGEVVINDGFGGKIDLDVTQEILLAIMSSDKSIGDIFEMPTARPYMSMMMD